MSFEEMDLPQEEFNETEEFAEENTVESAPGKFDKILGENAKKYRLTGMFREWFLD